MVLEGPNVGLQFGMVMKKSRCMYSLMNEHLQSALEL